MKLSLWIEIENAALVEDDGTPNTQAVARVLQRAVHQVADGLDGGKLRDENGNTVGAWSIGPE